MSEWWTYRLSDLILFSPDVYYRTFALYHHRVWPAHLVLFLFLVFAAIRWRRPIDDVARGRIAVGLAIACWIWVAVMFHLQSYASINWAAKTFAGAFILQAVLLAWFAGRRRVQLDARIGRTLLIGIVILAVATCIVGPLTGRQWDQIEVPGLTPDPTAAATILLLRLSSPAVTRLVLVIPAVSCLIGGLTLYALHSPEAWWTWMSALLALLWPFQLGSSRVPDIDRH